MNAYKPEQPTCSERPRDEDVSIRSEREGESERHTQETTEEAGEDGWQTHVILSNTAE
jgi:hypothetical protein